jgi:hypothetical protein
MGRVIANRSQHEEECIANNQRKSKEEGCLNEAGQSFLLRHIEEGKVCEHDEACVRTIMSPVPYDAGPALLM